MQNITLVIVMSVGKTKTECCEAAV